MHLALITAGGAGMFCGSCMHDNTLARALLDRGERVTLLPTYTPIRVDEANVSQSRVFLGGISVYLEAKVPFWRLIPRPMTRWLDSPGVIRLATRWGVSSDASKLGDMTLALLQGESGPEVREVQEFAQFIGRDLRPDVVLFSNALLAGTVRTLRQEYSGQVWCLLQGDDIFLEGLVEPWKSRSLAVLRDACRQFDGFLVHSAYYRDFMSEYLQLPKEKVHVAPLGIDHAGHDGQPRPRAGRPFTVGYFARICPEKGLHNLVAAFEQLLARHPESRLRAGGYLGARDAKYFQDLSKRTVSLGPAFEYIGSPATHAEKVEFFKSIDVLSVPTDYREPKGLYVLEALANGVPVVQPGHGSFPELIEATGGGLLTPPGDSFALAAALERLLVDDDLRVQLGTTGQVNARTKFGPASMAAATLEALGRSGREFVG
jgi:glycosyltransferase involved in cell wall biosynthesis